MYTPEGIREDRGDVVPFDVSRLPDSETGRVLVGLDDLLRMSAKLKRAESTGYSIACAMRFEDGSWSVGTNDERRDPFVHAEESALHSRGSKAPLTHVYLVGTGNNGVGDALKHTVPCEHCTHKIAAAATPDATVTVLSSQIPSENGARVGSELRLADIVESYKGNSEIPTAWFADFEGFLERNTRVIESDRKRLRVLNSKLWELLGPAYKLYLTGSATGRGGPKGLLAASMLQVPYQDLDVVLITPTWNAGFIGQLNSLFDSSEHPRDPYGQSPSRRVRGYRRTPYGFAELIDLSDSEETRVRQMSDETLERVVISGRSGDEAVAPIDLTIGTDITKAMTPQYLEKGWYVALHVASDFSLRRPT